MKRKLIRISVVLMLLVVAAAAYFFGKEQWHQLRYDATHQNLEVTSAEQIDSIFASFTPVAFKDLPESYLKETQSNDKAYKAKLSTHKFYALSRNDLFKKVMGNYRLKHFLSKDMVYAKCINNNTTYYSCIDKRVLIKFLELMHTLNKEGYNSSAIKLRSGHRHPKRNYYIGGASQSRHIYGEAIDIRVGDINKDGSSNKKDKQIVLDILEKKIIGNSGGIGLYPGTKAVHFDVRGHRARWNTYTPAIRK